MTEREHYILGQPPRLAPLTPDQCSEEQKQLIQRVGAPSIVQNQKGAEDKEWVEILARHPEVFMGHLSFTQTLLSNADLSPRDRELAVLRVGWLSQAPFEWGGHVPVGKACGITPEEIAMIIEGSDAPGWSKADRAIVRAAEELHRDSMISDETWADLAEFLNDRQLIELIMLIGHYKTVAYYQNSLRFRLPEGNEGLSAR